MGNLTPADLMKAVSWSPSYIPSVADAEPYKPFESGHQLMVAFVRRSSCSSRTLQRPRLHYVRRLVHRCSTSSASALCQFSAAP